MEIGDEGSYLFNFRVCVQMFKWLGRGVVGRTSLTV